MINDKKTYLIDTNSIITPFKTYYPFDFAQKFWNQLLHKIEEGEVLILDSVEDELLKGDDDLTEWVKSIDNSLLVSINDISIINNYRNILKYIQTSEFYNDKALKEWSDSSVADAWLIATAISKDCTIVTFERENGNLSEKSPSKNPKIPDVCNKFGVRWLDLF